MIKAFRLAWISIENPKFRAYTFLSSVPDASEFVDGFYLNKLGGCNLDIDNFGVVAHPHPTEGGFLLHQVQIPPDSLIAQDLGDTPKAGRDNLKKGFFFVTQAHGADRMLEARRLPIKKTHSVFYVPPILMEPTPEGKIIDLPSRHQIKPSDQKPLRPPEENPYLRIVSSAPQPPTGG